MKTEKLDIDGKIYEVRELTMEEGFPLISAQTGSLDVASLIRTATKIDGNQAQAGDISFGISMQLMPVVMKLNSFAGGEAGNG